jgi:Fur family ferric uptake transcriptional regulator
VTIAPTVHEQAALRLAGLDQRYSRVRRTMVTTLAEVARPLSIPEIVEASDGQLVKSSVYRIVAELLEAGVIRRINGLDETARYELAEELAGHHHHLACATCGTVEDVVSSARLERAMDEAARVIAEEHGYEVLGHQFDLVGTCPACQEARDAREVAPAPPVRRAGSRPPRI